ncbi:hypothetical protein FEM03_13505 [Phragmitibacter flavus]|uniref:Uncharacterized protein n=1 Tax=Phragmitibacter flavus TaxID=2576071 RepID=A0A5R8KD28_9BACT|nr:hypothetical protein [Phragmitibacter flavus]TLD70201.1 hypothetical protein FEM03_13505 [Phragmitibacter flavus]
MASSPVPQADTQLLPWLQNFTLKLTTHAGVLGFDTGAVTKAQEDCQALIYLINTYIPLLKNGLEEAYGYKDMIKNGSGSTLSALPSATAIPAAPTMPLPGALPRLRKLVQTIKNHPSYTTAIGQDLNIIVTGDSAVSIASIEAPTLVLQKSTVGSVTWRWNKDGWTGILVQSRKPGEVAWTQLGQDLFSPYVDTRPLTTPDIPEVREYRACYLDKEQPTQQWSDVLIITVQP